MTRPAFSLHVAAARQGDKTVLGRIALDVFEGETVALMGPSGIGKTTLLRIAAGLHTDYDGRLDLAGLAMVFQEPNLLPWRTLAENITLATGISAAQSRSWLADAGLAEAADRFASTLSLGQARRVSLARAFAASPCVLLMDEPFASLDETTADEMMALFERLRAQTRPATLIVTHSLAEAKRLADRVVSLAGSPACLVNACEPAVSV